MQSKDVLSIRNDSNVKNVCVNSTNVNSGDVFFALPGQSHDGHEFISDALKQGAAFAVVDKSKEHYWQQIHKKNPNKLIITDNVYEALIRFAKSNVELTNANHFIAVTGSVGKTTTKNMIHHILSEQDQFTNRIYASQKNFNSQIGLPICASNMPQDTKIGIYEMGMSEKSNISKLVTIVPPTISVITKVCEAHLQFFDSTFDIAKAKSEIFESDSHQFACVIPHDCAYFDFFKQKAKKHGIKHIVSFDINGNQETDAKVINYSNCDGMLSVTAEIFGRKIQYQLKTNNVACVENSIAAIVAAYFACDQNIDAQDLASALSSFVNMHQRGEVTTLSENRIILIDDSYNACPASVKAAIASLSSINFAGADQYKRVLVIGDMLELGPNSRHYHENLSSTIDKFGIDSVFACGENSKFLFDNLQNHKKGAWRENAKELSCVIPEYIMKEKSLVLVKGSRSMKMDTIVESIRQSCDVKN